jgi:hypothetical protein
MLFPSREFLLSNTYIPEAVPVDVDVVRRYGGGYFFKILMVSLVG